MKQILFVFILSDLIFGASYSTEKNIDRKITAISPSQQIENDWHFASLKSSAIDSGKLQIMANRICENSYQKIHSVLFIKDGKLVFEQYVIDDYFNLYMIVISRIFRAESLFYRYD